MAPGEPAAHRQATARRRGVGPAATAALLAIALAGCGNQRAARELRDARERALAAPYRIVRSGARTLYIAPDLLVIRGRRRVLVWARRDVEWLWNRRRACHRRVTDPNRADDRAVRADAAPPAATDVRAAVVRGRRTLRYEIAARVDAAAREGVVTLDARGRPTRLVTRQRGRAARIGAQSIRRRGSRTRRSPGPWCQIMADVVSVEEARRLGLPADIAVSAPR